MKKFKLKVTRKNGNKKDVAVYLDDTTASLLESVGDEKLLRAYLLEEYKSSRRDRQEEFWNRSLEEDIENGIDYEDRHTYCDFSFDDCENKNLQAAIKQLTPRQQEILRLVYIEGRSKTEIAKKYGVGQSAISHALERIFASLQKNYQKNKKFFGRPSSFAHFNRFILEGLNFMSLQGDENVLKN